MGHFSVLASAGVVCTCDQPGRLSLSEAVHEPLGVASHFPETRRRSQGLCPWPG